MSDRCPGSAPWARSRSSAGARPSGSGRRRAREVSGEVAGRLVPLSADEDVFEGRAEAGPGDDYRYRLDGGDALPDPCSWDQPEGVRGPSRVVDPGARSWDEGCWAGLDRRGLVLYELHVGPFTPKGTFAAAAERLPALAELGVTAIELMPVATFAGQRNWGATTASTPGRRAAPTAAPRAWRRSWGPPTGRASAWSSTSSTTTSAQARRRSRPSGRTTPAATARPGARRSTSTTATRGACASGRSRTPACG